MTKKKVVICMGSSCFSRGNARNVEIAEKFIQNHGLDGETDLDLDICGGLCSENCLDGPIVLIDGIVYKHVDTVLLQDLLETLIDPRIVSSAGEHLAHGSSES